MGFLKRLRLNQIHRKTAHQKKTGDKNHTTNGFFSSLHISKIKPRSQIGALFKKILVKSYLPPSGLVVAGAEVPVFAGAEVEVPLAAEPVVAPAAAGVAAGFGLFALAFTFNI